MITAAPDTVLQDGREVCILRAHQLEVGDVIVKHEAINLNVTNVRYPATGWVVADYACTAGSGSRTFTTTSFVSIQPRTAEEAH